MHFILLKIYNKNHFPPGFDFKTEAVQVQEHPHSCLNSQWQIKALEKDSILKKFFINTKKIYIAILCFKYIYTRTSFQKGMILAFFFLGLKSLSIAIQFSKVY